MDRRNLLSDPARQKSRDDKLWRREKHRANLYKFKDLYCPCTLCEGAIKKPLKDVFNDLVRGGRHPDCRVWRGPGEFDSSDEEWEASWTANLRKRDMAAVSKNADVDTQSMLQDMFQEVQSVVDTEEELDNITMAALETADSLIGSSVPSNAAEREAADRRPESLNEQCDNHKTDQDQRQYTVENVSRGTVSNKANKELEDARLEDVQALEDAMRDLYEGCSQTQLAATIVVSNLVATHPCMTEACANDMLAIMKWMLPTGNCLPSSIWQAQKLTKRLGLSFENIHACPKGCVLFRKEFANLDYCPLPTCKEPRYKNTKNKRGPRKVMRQFSVIVRLRRFFRIPALAKLMRWAEENQSTDGKVRYPADSPAWKNLDELKAEVLDTRRLGKKFGERSTDVRLQVSADGICPFKLHRSTWSAWPVFTTVLNLPPWLCTKKFFMLLSLLILGKEQVPFDKFDVFLKPLVEEFQDLWEGVPAYDALQPKGEEAFLLRAAVLYTTHDFPGYGTMSGASHQGYATCPPCGNQLRGRYSTECRKFIYRDARRWVQPNHYLRSSEVNDLLDGKEESRGRPTPKTPAQQQAALKEYQQWLAAPKRRRKSTKDPNIAQEQAMPDPSKIHGMKRGSIMYDLPYWRHNKIRNTLDVMHCEKNLMENILKTISGHKEKDSVKVRRDMQREGMRKHLWMMPDPNNPSRMVKPVANYVLRPEEFDIFCTRLESVKVPSNYCSELGSAIRNKKYGALKSHDYHILMQGLLPMALRGLLDRNTRTAIMRVCRVFCRICCKTWDPAQEQSLRDDVAVTMSLMDMTFPPSFFDIMSHLPMHLVEELFICGPVQVRWMYPVERNMMTLKNHVKNRARPEASIALGYLKDETMGLVTSYLQGFDVVRRRIWDADPEDCDEYEVLQGGSVDFEMTLATRDAAHAYILRNIMLMAPFYDEWHALNSNCGGIQVLAEWMKHKVQSLRLNMEDGDNHDIMLLSSAPALKARRYARMKAYGNHWRVDDDHSATLQTYNSGVACMENNVNFRNSNKDFVGVLQDIVQLNYGPLNNPLNLFFCQWKKRIDNWGNNTYIRDEDGFLVVNWKHNVGQDVDRFVFPSQCTQVFYKDDDTRVSGWWRVVMHKEARTHRVIEEVDDVIISTDSEPSGLGSPQSIAAAPAQPSIVSAIVLSDEDNVIATQSFDQGNHNNQASYGKRKRPGMAAGRKPKRAGLKHHQ